MQRSKTLAYDGAIYQANFQRKKSQNNSKMTDSKMTGSKMTDKQGESALEE